MSNEEITHYESSEDELISSTINSTKQALTEQKEQIAFPDFTKEILNFFDGTQASRDALHWTLHAHINELPLPQEKKEHYHSMIKNITNYELNPYLKTSIEELLRECGSPKITLFTKENPHSIHYYSVAHSHYYENTIYLLISSDYFSILIAELTHAEQFKRLGQNFYNQYATKDLPLQLIGKAYTTPGTLEYEAHKVTEPKFRTRVAYNARIKLQENKKSMGPDRYLKGLQQIIVLRQSPFINGLVIDDTESKAYMKAMVSSIVDVLDTYKLPAANTYIKTPPVPLKGSVRSLALLRSLSVTYGLEDTEKEKINSACMQSFDPKTMTVPNEFLDLYIKHGFPYPALEEITAASSPADISKYVKRDMEGILMLYKFTWLKADTPLQKHIDTTLTETLKQKVGYRKKLISIYPDLQEKIQKADTSQSQVIKLLKSWVS